MKTTTIITAKIKPDIYKLILTGKKIFEVRSEKFGNAHYIRYVSSETGELLGVHDIQGFDAFRVWNFVTELELAKIAAVPLPTLRELFGGTDYTAYIALTGCRYDSIDRAIELEEQ
jgi:hypothetical protein